MTQVRTGGLRYAEGKPKILLVDDLDANLMALSGLLRSEEVELIHARSGPDALERLLVEEFALAIVDVQMPRMNGFELAELMRGTERTRHIPIIFITAGAHNQQHRFRGYELGAVDFLFKPVEPDILRSKAAVFVDLYRIRQEMARQRDELARSREELSAELQAAREVEELSTRLIQAGDLNSLYDRIVETAVTIMGSDFASLQMLERTAANPELRLLAHRGFSPEAARFWASVTYESSSTCGAALRSGQRVVVPDIHRCDFMAGTRDLDVLKQLGVRAAQTTTLYSRSGELMGMLSTHWRKVHEPGARELGFFDVIARQAADLIERTKLESAMFQTQKLESIGLLAGGIAHDFNNLLVGILGGASLVMDCLPETDSMQPMLRGIVSAAERAAHLTRQMLAYAGKGRVLTEPVDMEELIRRTCDLVNSSIPKHVRLTLDFAGQLPPVLADSGQMEQIVMNLVLNAAESIDQLKSGTVIVRTCALEIDTATSRAPDLMRGNLNCGPYVAFEVRDDGCGMDTSTKARILDPFFTTKFTGRGLGLAAVDGILRSHNGALQVESAVGEGSVFRVFLPASPAAAPLPNSSSSGQAIRGNGAVLIVDDEETVRGIAAAALQRCGYSVRSVAAGEQAIEALSDKTAGPVSLIVLDMSMPGMSGRQTLERMRSLGIEAPVLICSGYTEAQVRGEFSGLEIVGVVPKPFTARELAERVSRALNKPATH